VQLVAADAAASTETENIKQTQAHCLAQHELTSRHTAAVRAALGY